jgi:hypothetical protein
VRSLTAAPSAWELYRVEGFKCDLILNFNGGRKEEDRPLKQLKRRRKIDDG